MVRAAHVFLTPMSFRTQYFLEEQREPIIYGTIMKTYDYNLHV